MKIAIISDTHAGVRNSSDIFIEYQQLFYEDVFFPYLLKNNIKQILHLGDYYEHRKFINFKALNANRKMFLEPLRQYGITMDIIPGNHDVFYKSTNDLCALKELLGYYTDCVNIISNPTEMKYGNSTIALIPWINTENYDDTMSFINKTRAPICAGHFEFTGFDLMKGVVNTHGMGTEQFDKFDEVWSGHFHTKSSKGNVTYFGSQMEFTWADCDDPKYFHVFDSKTNKVTPVLNPIKLFTKIVYDDIINDYTDHDFTQYKNKFIKVITSNKKDLYQYDKFVDSLNQSGCYEVKIAETFTEFDGENVDDDNIKVEDTTVLVNSYVDSVDTDLDKDKIKSMMNEFYVESMNFEIV